MSPTVARIADRAAFACYEAVSLHCQEAEADFYQFHVFVRYAFYRLLLHRSIPFRFERNLLHA